MYRKNTKVPTLAVSLAMDFQQVINNKYSLSCQ